MKPELIMLGTGNAMVTKCYNTCFALRNEEEYFLVDAGGEEMGSFHNWKKHRSHLNRSAICF